MRVLMKGRSRSDCAPYEVRVYRTAADRNRALKQAVQWWTYIVAYLDTQGPALTLGHSSWTRGHAYICR
jgi:hypothetical protein